MLPTIAERARQSPLSFIEYEVHSSSSGLPVCIKCILRDNTVKDCIVVVHQRISQLSSSGLINIESSHKFTRSGDTAYGCIKGVNLEQYQVGVVGSHGTRQLLTEDRKRMSVLIRYLYTCRIFSRVISLWCYMYYKFSYRFSIRSIVILSLN